MANVALVAPTVPIGSLSGSLGGANMMVPNILPAAEATSLATFTGFSFPNNGAVILRVVTGGSGACTLSFNLTRLVEGELPAVDTYAQASSVSALFGPFSPADYNDINGLVQCAVSVVTGNSVGVYQLPQSHFGTQFT